MKRSEGYEGLEVDEAVHHDTKKLLPGMLHLQLILLIRAVKPEYFIEHVPGNALNSYKCADHPLHNRTIQRNIASLRNHQLGAPGEEVAEVGAVAGLGFEQEVEGEDEGVLDVVRVLHAIEMLHQVGLLLLHGIRHILSHLEPLPDRVALVKSPRQLLPRQLVRVLVRLVASLVVLRILQQALQGHEVDEDGGVD